MYVFNDAIAHHCIVLSVNILLILKNDDQIFMFRKNCLTNQIGGCSRSLYRDLKIIIGIVPLHALLFVFLLHLLIRIMNYDDIHQLY